MHAQRPTHHLREDRVRRGAFSVDDYLVKPFAFEELTARIRALGRRPAGRAEPVLAAGAIELDVGRHEVRRAGRVIELAPTEFRLLEFFMRHPAQALSRRRILAAVWGDDAEPDTNVVDLYVHYLRRKLDADAPIQTVRGVGYRFEPADGR